MSKKSAAQIRRMQQRAVARGTEYVTQENDAQTAENSASENNEASTVGDKRGVAVDMQVDSTEVQSGNSVAHDQKRLAAANTLKQTLEAIEQDTEMNAKSRRAAKRKAEAIAIEKAGCPVDDLLKIIDEVKEKEEEEVRRKESSATEKKNPYVLFVGQLAYSTTAAGLFDHFQESLGKKVITSEILKIRLLTDQKKNNRSKGMAFIEVNDPQLLYECLKLHHTTLDGRRINVERTSGGGRSSEKRKEKIKQFRKEQHGEN